MQTPPNLLFFVVIVVNCIVENDNPYVNDNLLAT